MKRLIELTNENSVAINRVIYKHPELSKEIPWQIKDFTIRLIVDGKALLLDCRIDNKGFHFEGHEENSVLRVTRGFPSFYFSATLHKGKVNITRMTKDKEAVEWLTKKNGIRNAVSEFIYLALHSSVALTHLEPILLKREINGTTEYKLPKDFENTAEAYIAYDKAVKYREHFLDGWDIVNLTENQYYKVIETNQQNKIEYDMENIPLPRFCLAIYDGKETDYYFYEKKGKTIHCGVTDPDTRIVKYFDVIITGQTQEGISSTLHVDDKEKGLWQWLTTAIAEDGGTNWEWCADTFFIINTFILHFGDVTMEVETKVANESTENKQRRKGTHHNSVRLFKSYKLIKNWKSQARKKAEITCPAWGVRGHFRHYRNGKTIFIESYVKGKEKDKYKGKEYNLLPYKEA